MEEMSTKKKIIIAVVVAVVTIVAIVAVFMFGPDPMPVDWSKVHLIPTNVTLLAAEDEKNPTDASALVKLNEDGSVDTTPWKILQFTDMHLTQAHDKNEVSLNYFIDTLNREKPDFVVLTGDIITRPLGRARAIQLADIFEKAGVYWCYCLGNHEGDSAPFTLSREENVRIWSKYDHCLLENDVKKTSDGTEVWGLGNTVVNLLGADYKVVQSLIFMDSGGKIRDSKDPEAINMAKEMGEPDDSYDFLKTSQLKWYEEQVKAVTENFTNGAKTMLFIHIPLVEQSYIKLIQANEVLPEGWHYASPEEPVMVGDKLYGYMIVKDGWSVAGDTCSYEKCYCSFYNNGTYDLMKSMRKGVNALFCGHDHISNSILYEDDIKNDDPVYLCYGVCSGLQSYNLYKYGLSETNDYALRGYAVIEVNADATFSVYHVRYNDVDNRVARIIDGVAQ